MGKPAPNLNGVLDGLPPTPAPSTETAFRARPRSRRAEQPTENAPTVLVGANLPPSYARNLAFLHAETGRSKKELLQEALEMLFTSKGGPNMKL